MVWCSDAVDSKSLCIYYHLSVTSCTGHKNIRLWFTIKTTIAATGIEKWKTLTIVYISLVKSVNSSSFSVQKIVFLSFCTKKLTKKLTCSFKALVRSEVKVRGLGKRLEKWKPLKIAWISLVKSVYSSSVSVQKIGFFSFGTKKIYKKKWPVLLRPWWGVR